MADYRTIGRRQAQLRAAELHGARRLGQAVDRRLKEIQRDRGALSPADRKVLRKQLMTELRGAAA
ncbi:MAG: hypothetical protein KGH72_01030 [Candidatus Micrarchaeota archaeon]|nr:hypothetical protein [Candidatus Micrarchaeota archaeon]